MTRFPKSLGSFASLAQPNLCFVSKPKNVIELAPPREFLPKSELGLCRSLAYLSVWLQASSIIFH